MQYTLVWYNGRAVPSCHPSDRTHRKVRHMGRPVRYRWLWVAILVAIVYPIVGITFALPTNSPTSGNIVVAWRLAAWLVSAAAFAAHITFEHTRLHNAPLRAALHTSLAVALGGLRFGRLDTDSWALECLSQPEPARAPGTGCVPSCDRDSGISCCVCCPYYIDSNSSAWSVTSCPGSLNERL